MVIPIVVCYATWGQGFKHDCGFPAQGFAGEMGDLAGAQRLTAEAHSRQLSVLGKDHPDVVLTEHNQRRLELLHANKAAGGGDGGGGGRVAAARGRRRSSALSVASSTGSGRSAGSGARLSARPPRDVHDGAAGTLTPRAALWGEAVELQVNRCEHFRSHSTVSPPQSVGRRCGGRSRCPAPTVIEQLECLQLHRHLHRGFIL